MSVVYGSWNLFLKKNLKFLATQRNQFLKDKSHGSMQKKVMCKIQFFRTQEPTYLYERCPGYAIKKKKKPLFFRIQKCKIDLFFNFFYFKKMLLECHLKKKKPSLNQLHGYSCENRPFPQQNFFGTFQVDTFRILAPFEGHL